MTMREKLCRAACIADGLDPDRKYSSSSDHPANAPFEHAWQEYGQQIDAILETLASPDDRMIDAGMAKRAENYRTDEIFTAMINHVRAGK